MTCHLYLLGSSSGTYRRTELEVGDWSLMARDREEWSRVAHTAAETCDNPHQSADISSAPRCAIHRHAGGLGLSVIELCGDFL